MALKFGNIDLADFHFRLIDIEEDLLPQIVNSYTSMPSGEGTIIMSKGMQGRRIKLTGRIIAPDKATLEQRKQDLAAALISEQIYTLQDKKLSLPDRPYHYYATVDGYTPVRPILDSADVEINFYAADPFKYGDQKSIEAPEGAIELTVTNAGTYPCYFNIVIGAHVRTEAMWNDISFIKNLSLSERNTITYNYKSPSELVVTANTARETVTLGGEGTDLEVSLDTDFFMLEKGDNMIACYSSRASNPMAAERWFTVEYRERYL